MTALRYRLNRGLLSLVQVGGQKPEFRYLEPGAVVRLLVQVAPGIVEVECDGVIHAVFESDLLERSEIASGGTFGESAFGSAETNV